jgi:hypothetical protein
VGDGNEGADKEPQTPAPDPTPPEPPETPPAEGEGAPGEGHQGEGGRGQPWDKAAHAAVTKAQQEAAEYRRQMDAALLAQARAEARAEAMAQPRTPVPAEPEPPEDEAALAIDKTVSRTPALRALKKQNEELQARLTQQDRILAGVTLRSQRDDFPLYFSDSDVKQAVDAEIQRGATHPDALAYAYGKYAAIKLARENAELKAKLTQAAKAAPAARAAMADTDIGGASSHAASGGHAADDDDVPLSELQQRLDDARAARGGRR